MPEAPASRQQRAGLELNSGGIEALGDGVEEAAGATAGIASGQREALHRNEQAMEDSEAEVRQRLVEVVLDEAGAQQSLVPGCEHFELVAASFGGGLAAAEQPRQIDGTETARRQLPIEHD